jgi:Cytidylate kinase-like family
MDAHDQAFARFYDLVNQQARALSCMDTFWILGALCSVMFVLAFFLKRNDPGAGGDVAVVMIQAITVDRKFGCGGSEIAAKLAQLLGWRLWDHELTQEIARLTNSTPQAVEKREWRNDPAVYRVFESFLRGAFEGGLPPTHRLELLDARRIATASESAVNHALSGGPCVIVAGARNIFFAIARMCFGCSSMLLARLRSNG